MTMSNIQTKDRRRVPELLITESRKKLHKIYKTIIIAAILPNIFRRGKSSVVL